MPEDAGIQFPLGANGQRGTMEVNQATLAAAIEAVDKEEAAAVRANKKWRFGYAKHVLKNVGISASRPENALKVAEAGLKYLHSTMTFVRDGSEMPLAQAMAKFTATKFATKVVKGEGRRERYAVKYGGKVLQGQALDTQVEKWLSKGCIELSAANSLCRVNAKSEWSDLSDKYFVLFGAGSAMGPFEVLMSLGANVIAIDLPIPKIWERLERIAKQSSGTLYVPVVGDVAGVDLLKDTPEVRTWLLQQAPKEQLVLGGYCYLDGALFVRVSVAMDAIMQDCIAQRKVKPAVAYLCTPTDAHLCTAASVAASKSNLARAPLWQKLFAMASLAFPAKRRMKKNTWPPIRQEDGSELYVCDAIVPEQGPNYLLAKRLQHWRAMVARRDGCVVSTNVAPATSTVSVTKNFSFKLAFAGMHWFRAMEIFEPETSNTVMTGLLISDLRDPGSAAHPATALKNPLCLMTENAAHGGNWRCAYSQTSLGVPATLAGLLASAASPYMILYTLVQVAILLMTAAQLVSAAAAGTPVSDGAAWYAAAGSLVFLAQHVMLLEMVHAVLGITRSSIATLAMQLFSRVHMAHVMLHVPDAWPQATVGVMAAWTVADLTRNLYYLASMFKLSIGPLTWARYSLFIVNYPVGVGCELMVMYAAMKGNLLSRVRAQGTLDDWVLSAWNGGIRHVQPYMDPFVLLFLVWGVLGLGSLYTYMLAQRRKKFGTKKKTE